MPGQEDSLRIINLPANKEDIAGLIAALQPLKEEIKSFSGLAIGSKNTNGSADFKTQATQIAEALTRIKALEAELEAIRSKNAGGHKARTDEEIRQQVRLQEQTRARVAGIKAESDAYRQLQLEANKATAEFKRLAAEYGNNSKQANEARLVAMKYRQELNEINESIGNHQNKVGGYLTSIKEFFSEVAAQALLFIGVYQAFDFLKDSVNEFIHAQQEASKLRNILSNLGRTDAFERLDRSAEELSKRFQTFKKEDVTEVFDKLIVYGKLTENQMNDLMPVIINFAAQTGQSLGEASEVIIKAMEGNTRGLKAFGIEVQKGANPLDNLSTIMRDLKPRVEGAADAFGNTLAGQMKKTEVSVDELKKEIGEDLEPATRGFLSFLAKGLEGIGIMAENLKRAFSGIAYSMQKDREEQDKQNAKNAEDLLRQDNFRSEKRAQQERDLKFYTEQYENAKKDVEDLQDEPDGGKKNSVLAQRTNDMNKFAEAMKQAKEIMGEGNKVLGFGDDAENRKKDEKWIDDLIKHYEILKNTIIIDNEAIADSEKLPLFSRKIAIDESLKAEENFIVQKMNLELKREKLSAQEIQNIRDQADSDLFKARMDYYVKLQKASAQYLQMERDDELQTLKELKDARALYYDSQEKALKLASDQVQNANNESRDILLKGLESRFAAGLIKEKDYNEQKKKLIADTLKYALEAQLKELEGEKALAEAKNLELPADKRIDITKIDADIAKKKLEIEQNKDAGIIESNKKTEAEKKKIQDAEINLAKKSADTVFEILKAPYERELNAIQDQIDANNKLKETETRNIDASTLSATQKAAQQIELDAKVAANNEALQRKQKEIKTREAEFDRAKAIFDIVANTAVAVTRALPDIVLAAIVGATGAVELAAVLDKPVPKYEKGTDFAPEGPAIVHPGEMRIDPSGRITMTPDRPSLTFLERGTKIIPAHEVNAMRMQGILSKGMGEPDRNLEKEIVRLNDTLERTSREQVKAFGKNRTNIHIHNDAGFMARIQKDCS